MAAGCVQVSDCINRTSTIELSSMTSRSQSSGFSSFRLKPNTFGSTLRRDTAVMMAAALLLVPIFAFGQMTRLSGLVLFGGLVAYLVWAYLKPVEAEAEDDSLKPPASTLVSVLWVIGGLVALMVGARFLVDGAVSIARGYGIFLRSVELTQVIEIDEYNAA
jgi:cation:H+ antiporter